CIEENIPNQVYYDKYDTCTPLSSKGGQTIIESLKRKYPVTVVPLPLPIPVAHVTPEHKGIHIDEKYLIGLNDRVKAELYKLNNREMGNYGWFRSKCVCM